MGVPLKKMVRLNHFLQPNHRFSNKLPQNAVRYYAVLKDCFS